MMKSSSRRAWKDQSFEFILLLLSKGSTLIPFFPKNAQCFAALFTHSNAADCSLNQWDGARVHAHKPCNRKQPRKSDCSNDCINTIKIRPSIRLDFSPSLIHHSADESTKEREVDWRSCFDRSTYPHGVSFASSRCDAPLSTTPGFFGWRHEGSPLPPQNSWWRKKNLHESPLRRVVRSWLVLQ